MARASGLKAFAQASDNALSMRMLDGTLFRATHVNAGVLIDGEHHSVDVGWRGVAAGREPRRISDARTVALLRNNHAVEHLLQVGGAPERARVHDAHVRRDPSRDFVAQAQAGFSSGTPWLAPSGRFASAIR